LEKRTILPAAIITLVVIAEDERWQFAVFFVVFVFSETHPPHQKQRLRGNLQSIERDDEEVKEEEERTLPASKNQRRWAVHVSRVGVRFSAHIEIELDVLGRNERGRYVKNGCFRANVQRGGEKERTRGGEHVD
jgi:hypothetical protein